MRLFRQQTSLEFSEEVKLTSAKLFGQTSARVGYWSYKSPFRIRRHGGQANNPPIPHPVTQPPEVPNPSTEAPILEKKLECSSPPAEIIPDRFR